MKKAFKCMFELTYLKCKIVLIILLSVSFSAKADVSTFKLNEIKSRGVQQVKITGKVTDKNSEALPGVTILIEGTRKGTTTDFDGNYSINAQQGDVLVFSFVSMQTQKITVGNTTIINVVLQDAINQLDEVVVTALGITKEKKVLGYSVQEVKTEELNKAQTVSIGSKLSGKVAGLQVNTSSKLGGSSRFVIRGENTLSLGGNEALIVVDGVPISGTTSTDESVDYGGGSLDFNSDNIESISVLKGPAAAALYGSRAGNGVVLITTKSGKGGKPFSVELKNTVMFESLLSYPDTYQYKYAPGVGATTDLFTGRGEYNPNANSDSWSTVVYDPSKYIEWFYSPTSNGYRAGDTDIENKGIVTRYPFVSTEKNNFEEFFRTGHSLFNSVSFSTNSERINTRFSFENAKQIGIQPNTGLDRNTLSANINSNLTDKLKVNFVINFSDIYSKNRPQSVWNSNDVMNALFSMPPGTRIDQLKNYWQPGLEGRRRFGYNRNPNGPNPYYVSFARRAKQDRKRLFGNVNLTYNFTDALSLMLRHGDDFVFEERKLEETTAFRERPDYYGVTNIKTREFNTDFLLSYKKDITKDFNLNLSLGGNIFNSKYENRRISSLPLIVPGTFSLNNINFEGAPRWKFGERNTKKRVYSLYSFADLSYQNWAFLSLTARNDWSSTLPEENRSYFYPSASLSIIASELLELPEVISFLKFRGAFAQVGKDTSPQQLSNTINVGSVPSNLLNPDLKPETATSYEFGLDFRLFGGRIGFDATYYNGKTKNQIIPITLPETSGYNARLTNAGLIKNSGIEMKLDAKVINSNDFKWNTTLVYTANDNEVVELTKDLKQYKLANFPNGYGAIISKVGYPVMGVFGYKQQTVEDKNSPFFGQKVHNVNGSPLRKGKLEYLGNVNPDFLLGITNQFDYKDFSLSFLVDIRQGGKLFSTNTDWMFSGGFNTITQQWRDQGGVNGGGVIRQADGTYRENDVTVKPENLKQQYSNPYRVISENNTYDASYVKLREVNFTYNFPKSLTDRLPIESASFSLMGRDLFIWDDVPNQDPDILQRGIPGYSGIYGTVSTRSYGASFKFTF